MQIPRARKPKQLLPAALVHQLCAGVFLPVAQAAVDHPLEHVHFLLQAVISAHLRLVRFAADLAPAQRAFQLQNGLKLFALLLQPQIFLVGVRAGKLGHVIAVINFFRVNIALRSCRLPALKRHKRRQQHRRAVHQRQLAPLLPQHGHRPGAHRTPPQAQPRKRRGRAQPRGAEHQAKARQQRRAIQRGGRPLHQRQGHGRVEPVQVAVIAQQLVGAQKAGKVCVFDHIQAAGGRDGLPHQPLSGRQRQGGAPARRGPAAYQRRKHHPQAHHKSGGPFGQQKAPQVLPHRDLHGAAHQRGHALNAAAQRPQPKGELAVRQVHTVQHQQHRKQAYSQSRKLCQGGFQPPARGAAHQRQQPVFPLLPHEKACQQQHGRQQQQVCELVVQRGEQPLLRRIVDLYRREPHVHRRRFFNVGPVVAAFGAVKDRNTRQLPRFLLHLLQKLRVGGHRVQLRLDLAQKTVFLPQVLGIQGIALVFINVLVLFKQLGVLAAGVGTPLGARVQGLLV